MRTHEPPSDGRDDEADDLPAFGSMPDEPAAPPGPARQAEHPAWPGPPPPGPVPPPAGVAPPPPAGPPQPPWPGHHAGPGQAGSGYPPPGYGPGYPPPGYGPVPVRQNQKALWSMIVGIGGVVCCALGLVAGAVAIVLAILARQEIARSGGRETGGGMAVAGLVLGIVALVMSVASWTLSGLSGLYGWD